MRLSLKAKILSIAVVLVLLFALLISVATVLMLMKQAEKDVEETRRRLFDEADWI